MGSYFLFGLLITWPPFNFPHPKEFFQFLSHLFSLFFLYLFHPHLYNSFAINFLGSSWLNSFSSSSSSCCLSSLVSSLYSLSNSFSNFFTFSRFSLPFQVSSSTVYSFHLTKNFFFPLTVLLFNIFSISNFSSPSMMTSFGNIFFCSFVSNWLKNLV